MSYRSVQSVRGHAVNRRSVGRLVADRLVGSGSFGQTVNGRVGVGRLLRQLISQLVH